MYRAEVEAGVLESSGFRTRNYSNYMYCETHEDAIKFAENELKNAKAFFENDVTLEFHFSILEA